MKKVKYIGFYDLEDYLFEKRVRSIAAVNKMNYIVSALGRAGYSVEIISPSWTSNSIGYYKNRSTIISDNIFLKMGPSFGANNYFTKKIRILFSWFWLFCYLIRNTKKNEKVIVYHSIMAIFPIYFAHKFKNFKIILELNELYQNVNSLSSIQKTMEDQIIKKSDSYILSTNLLKSKIDFNKDFLINYGDYRVPVKFESQYKDKVHVVYAGIIDKNKAGAFNAVDSAKYLSGNYKIHIIGFGNYQDILELKTLIKNNNLVNDCKVKYDGLKLGNDYFEYISNCQIGLSTQTSSGEYNDSSFPSKVLSYLGLGLRVVSVKIKAIKSSEVGSLLYYYNENNGRSIADAIVKIDMNSQYDSKSILEGLDKCFINDLKKIIN